MPRPWSPVMYPSRPPRAPFAGAVELPERRIQRCGCPALRLWDATRLAIDKPGLGCATAQLQRPDHPRCRHRGCGVRSPDEGNIWSAYDVRLPNAPVGQMFRDGDFLYAVTYGRGLWRRRCVNRLRSALRSSADDTSRRGTAPREGQAAHCVSDRRRRSARRLGHTNARTR